MLSLPRSARVAWWLTAWLRGQESADAAIAFLATEIHTVIGLPDGETLLDLLTALRRADATYAGLAMPRHGDPLGLGGPAAFNEAAMECGEAVISNGLGLVPDDEAAASETSGVWRVCAAERRLVSDVGEADRALRQVIAAAASALAELDIAKWRPEVADVLINLRHLPELDPPLGVPDRCVDLAARGLQASHIVALAQGDDGAAVSAWEAQRRRDALDPLERAARRAIVSACSPEAWPDVAPR